MTRGGCCFIAAADDGLRWPCCSTAHRSPLVFLFHCLREAEGTVSMFFRFMLLTYSLNVVGCPLCLGPKWS